MLRVVAQYKHSRNFILLGIIIILAIGMIAAYSLPGGSLFGFGSRGPKVAVPVSDDEVIAEVNGKIITAKEYLDGMQRYLDAFKQYASQSPAAQLPHSVEDLRKQGTDKELLRSLLRNCIIELESERLGLTATDDEVRTRIREQFSKDGRWIGYEKFKKALDRQGTDVLDFERGIRKSIAEEKLRSFITGGIQISPREIETDYKNSNTKLEMSFVAIKDIDFSKTVTAPTDVEIRSYFDSHKEIFRSEKDQRKVKYIYINQEKAGETVPVSDEELRKRYDPEKQIKSIKVKQIVLSVLTPKDENIVKNKATELVKRARGTGSNSGEDFDTLAKGNSQDTATAPTGGNLGVVERSNVKSGDALESAFSLKVNEISEPVKKGDKYYIFKVIDRTSKTFEEAKEGLLASTRNDLSYKRASDLAEKAGKLLAQTRDIQKAATEISREMKIDSKELIRETPFFVPGDDVPEIGSNPSFEESTSVLTEKNEVGVKVGVRGGFAIPQLAEIRKPGEPVFEEVKDKVIEKTKKEKMLKMAADQARTLIANAENLAGLKSAAEKLGLKIEEAKDFGNSSATLGDKTYPSAFYMAEKLKTGELVQFPIYSSEASSDADVSVVVIGVSSHKDADLTKFSEQTKSIEERLRSSRATAMFDAYIDNLKFQLKSTGRLTVYNDILERVLMNVAASDSSASSVPQ